MTDAATMDGATGDAGPMDAATNDASTSDGGPMDGAITDGGAVDPVRAYCTALASCKNQPAAYVDACVQSQDLYLSYYDVACMGAIRNALSCLASNASCADLTSGNKSACVSEVQQELSTCLGTWAAIADFCVPDGTQLVQQRLFPVMSAAELSSLEAVRASGPGTGRRGPGRGTHPRRRRPVLEPVGASNSC